MCKVLMYASLELKDETGQVVESARKESCGGDSNDDRQRTGCFLRDVLLPEQLMDRCLVCNLVKLACQ